MAKKQQIKSVKSKQKVTIKPIKLPEHLEHINQRAAGIDVGSSSHYVAVPEGSSESCVREFKSFTKDLYALADWLNECQIETVVMESTGVYWIPLFEILESRGFEVKLVDARHVKHVSGRKSDVSDCQWLQRLHTYGLLNGAFRPEDKICILRSYLRQRAMLIQHIGMHVQHMQKALTQMNLQLNNVIGRLTGGTGLNIIRALINGERDPKKLAIHRDPRCKHSQIEIEQSLVGNYREEHMFALKQALELYDIYHEKMNACDEQIEQLLFTFDSQINIEKEILDKRRAARRTRDKNAPLFNAKAHLKRIIGVDITAIPGIDADTGLKIISEVGYQLSEFRTGKQFASWLGLCPGNKISGGKVLNPRTKKSPNRAAAALRMAASTLHRSQSALGAFLRRLKTRLGSPKAITATAHKLALILFNMLKYHTEYQEMGQAYYEQQYRERVLKGLRKRAKILGFELLPIPEQKQNLVEVI